MVTPAEALEVLYPAAVPLVDYVVRDAGDGLGPRVVFWSPALGPEPTADQLAAVTAGQVTAARRAREPDLRDLLDQAAGAVAAIDAYLAIADAATAAQVRAEVKAIDQRQRRVVQVLRRVVQRTWGD